jgi:ERF superfamily
MTDAVAPLSHTDVWSTPARPWATSADIDQLAGSLVAALGELSDVPRDRTAAMGTYSYRYADLAAVLGVVRPVLAAHGLGLTQWPTVEDGDAVVTTTIWHTSGQWLAAPPLRLPAGDTAQQVGSAISYARRYTLLAVLGMATEDDDGAAASRQSTPVLMPQRYVDRFREALVEAGLDAADGAVIVGVATDGRTDDVEAVWQSEVEALSAALADYRARRAAPEPTTPPDTPDEPRANEPEPEAVSTP